MNETVVVVLLLQSFLLAIVCSFEIVEDQTRKNATIEKEDFSASDPWEGRSRGSLKNHRMVLDDPPEIWMHPSLERTIREYLNKTEVKNLPDSNTKFDHVMRNSEIRHVSNRINTLMERFFNMSPEHPWARPSPDMLLRLDDNSYVSQHPELRKTSKEFRDLLADLCKSLNKLQDHSQDDYELSTRSEDQRINDRGYESQTPQPVVYYYQLPNEQRYNVSNNRDPLWQKQVIRPVPVPPFPPSTVTVPTAPSAPSAPSAPDTTTASTTTTTPYVPDIQALLKYSYPFIVHKVFLAGAFGLGFAALTASLAKWHKGRISTPQYPQFSNMTSWNPPEAGWNPHSFGWSQPTGSWNPHSFGWDPASSKFPASSGKSPASDGKHMSQGWGPTGPSSSPWGLDHGSDPGKDSMNGSEGPSTDWSSSQDSLTDWSYLSHHGPPASHDTSMDWASHSHHGPPASHDTSMDWASHSHHGPPASLDIPMDWASRHDPPASHKRSKNWASHPRHGPPVSQERNRDWASRSRPTASHERPKHWTAHSRPGPTASHDSPKDWASRSRRIPSRSSHDSVSSPRKPQNDKDSLLRPASSQSDWFYENWKSSSKPRGRPSAPRDSEDPHEDLPQLSDWRDSDWRNDKRNWKTYPPYGRNLKFENVSGSHGNEDGTDKVKESLESGTNDGDNCTSWKDGDIYFGEKDTDDQNSKHAKKPKDFRYVLPNEDQDDDHEIEHSYPIEDHSFEDHEDEDADTLHSLYHDSDDPGIGFSEDIHSVDFESDEPVFGSHALSKGKDCFKNHDHEEDHEDESSLLDDAVPWSYPHPDSDAPHLIDGEEEDEAEEEKHVYKNYYDSYYNSQIEKPNQDHSKHHPEDEEFSFLSNLKDLFTDDKWKNVEDPKENEEPEGDHDSHEETKASFNPKWKDDVEDEEQPKSQLSLKQLLFHLEDSMGSSDHKEDTEGSKGEKGDSSFSGKPKKKPSDCDKAKEEPKQGAKSPWSFLEEDKNYFPPNVHRPSQDLPSDYLVWDDRMGWFPNSNATRTSSKKLSEESDDRHSSQKDGKPSSGSEVQEDPWKRYNGAVLKFSESKPAPVLQRSPVYEPPTRKSSTPRSRRPSTGSRRDQKEREQSRKIPVQLVEPKLPGPLITSSRQQQNRATDPRKNRMRIERNPVSVRNR